MNERNLIALLSSEETRSLTKNVTNMLRRRSRRYEHIPINFETFANGEVLPHVTATIRSKDIYLLHSCFHPDPNTGLMKLFVAGNAISLASPESLTFVIPYIPYMRQDRKDKPRKPISAKLLANLIVAAGGRKLERIITMDLHVEQEEGFFDIPVDNMPGRILFAEHFRKIFKNDFSNVTVVAPDINGVPRAQRFADMINAPLSVIRKERHKGAKVKTKEYIGDNLEGRNAILVDDMIDTGNTTIAGMEEILRQGARSVHACCTHAIFSPKGGSSAEEKLRAFGSPVVTTTSIPRTKEYYQKNRSWLTAIPIDRLLSRVLYESDRPGGSVSSQVQ